MAVTTGKLVTSSTISGAVSLSGTDTITGQKDFTGAVSFLDANLTLKDQTDTTKQAKVELSGISTGTTRTITLANASGTMVLDSATQTLSGKTLTAPLLSASPTFGDSSQAVADTAYVQGLVAYGQLTSDYTLTSTVTTQKLFNFSTNGALDLATGRYRFRAMLYLTTMSAAAADNLRFRLGGAGTATLANIWYQTIGQDSATAMAVGALSGTGSVTAASETNIVTGATAAETFVTVDGWFNVTVAGTIIPSCNLNTAAAAVVKAGSGIIVEYLGATGSNTKGSWS